MSINKVPLLDGHISFYLKRVLHAGFKCLASIGDPNFCERHGSLGHMTDKNVSVTRVQQFEISQWAKNKDFRTSKS